MAPLNLILGTVFGDDLTGTDGIDVIFGGRGNDTIAGGLGNDWLFGDSGDDFLAGDKGDDFMSGGAGNDVLDWDDGDGSDIMSGGSGYDTIEVDGSVTRGDNFTLEADGHRAIFTRVGLDGQTGVGSFTLTVDTAEAFDVSGDGGNDSFIVGNLGGTGIHKIAFDGGEGDDLFDAQGSSVRVEAFGGSGADRLIGSQVDDLLVGGEGVDTMTGGGGRDRFLYNGNPFANGTAAATPNGIVALNRPDIITDFTLGHDQFALDGHDLGIDSIHFRSGLSNQLTDGNVLVLTDGFANAAAAARAIDNNQAIDAEAGVFVYFNTTLGISRLVYSENLGDGGPISVLANLTSLTNVGNQANFGAQSFTLV